MPIFEYTAFNKEGKSIKGEYEAKDRSEVVEFLHGKDLVAAHIDERIMAGFKDLVNFQIGGVPLSNKVIFAKQLSTMVSAGLPLVQALEVLSSQEKNVAFKKSLEKVTDLVEGGNKLSKSFAQQKGIFSDVELNLIAAGEASGNLVEILQKVAVNMERRKNFQSKLKGAMIYPIVLSIAVCAVIIMLLMFMVPAVEDLYADFDADLPWMTQIIISLSHFFTAYWWAIVFGMIAGSISLKYYYASPSGREVIDKMFLMMPIFGQLVTKSQIAEFGRLLSMLLKSGIPIIDALNIVGGSLPNIHFKKALADAATDVEKGIPLAVPLSKNEYIPLIFSRIVATGESTGKLDKVLDDIAKFYQTEVDDMTSNLTKMMEPIILLVVGGAVGFLALAVYGPIYGLASVIE